MLYYYSQEMFEQGRKAGLDFSHEVLLFVVLGHSGRSLLRIHVRTRSPEFEWDGQAISSPGLSSLLLPGRPAHEALTNPGKLFSKMSARRPLLAPSIGQE